MSERESTKVDSLTDGAELRKMRDEEFEKIAALALLTDERVAKSSIRRYRALGKAVDMAEPEPDLSKYGRYKQASQAIAESLERVGRAIDPEDVVADLVANGFRRGKKTAATDVRKSIGFHLDNPRGKKSKVIRSMNCKIGLWNWPDSKF